jgi:hypothetical protein
MNAPFRDFSEDPMRRADLALAHLRATHRAVQRVFLATIFALILNLFVMAVNFAYVIGWLTR